jgi:hypothetical protein
VVKKMDTYPGAWQQISTYPEVREADDMEVKDSGEVNQEKDLLLANNSSNNSQPRMILSIGRARVVLDVAIRDKK